MVVENDLWMNWVGHWIGNYINSNGSKQYNIWLQTHQTLILDASLDGKWMLQIRTKPVELGNNTLGINGIRFQSLSQMKKKIKFCYKISLIAQRHCQIVASESRSWVVICWCVSFFDSRVCQSSCGGCLMMHGFTLDSLLVCLSACMRFVLSAIGSISSHNQCQ